MSTKNLTVPIDVDMTRSTSGVWLVKVPKYLSRILNDHADKTVNGEVGRLIKRPLQFDKGSSTVRGRSREVVFRLNDQIIEKLKQENPSEDYKLPPQEHRFCLNNTSDGILRTFYSRTLSNANSSSSEQIALIGTVIQRAEVLPVENEQYMSMKRKHIETFQEPARKAQMINIQKNLYKPKSYHKEENQLKKTAVKRVRISEDIVIKLLFEAFSNHQYISMSSLEEMTQQPKLFLQQLVKRFCTYNNAGHTYELKPHFRHYDGSKAK